MRTLARAVRLRRDAAAAFSTFGLEAAAIQQQSRGCSPGELQGREREPHPKF